VEGKVWILNTMQQIIFEQSPAYLLLWAILAVAGAYLLYRGTHPWSGRWNKILFGLRAVLIFLLLALLLGPIVRQINNLYEKPVVVILHDNSVSMKEAGDTTQLANLNQTLETTKQQLEDKGFEVVTTNFDGTDDLHYKGHASDIHGALRRVVNRFEGRSVAGVVLESDGIYNVGLSPLFASYNFPVHTLGVGDTSIRTDVAIRNVAYNKIAYQGNKFPLRVEIMGQNIANQPIQVSLSQRGNVLDRQIKNLKDGELLSFDFQPQANEQGLQKFDIQVEVKAGEVNTRNNKSSVFVEVVEGKKKILLVASAPHPDIKALKEVIDKNSNYEFLLHIPGVKPLQAADLNPSDIDLAIFHQSPDVSAVTTGLFQQFAKSKTSLFVIIGQRSDLRQVTALGMPLKVDAVPHDFDEVTPVANPAFPNFSISPEANSLLVTYPPLSVHFGKISVPLQAAPLLYQQVGSLATQKPLLAVEGEDRKIAILLGEGIWRWRLSEFDRTEKTLAFDEVFGKLIQFLSTTDDKRKFRSYPIQQEFLDTHPVIMESQVYNDVFEPVYGNAVTIQITSEAGKRNQYTYVTSPGNSRYQIGGLKEGVYRYVSKTTINQKEEVVRGEFAVTSQQVELQNLTADHDLLRKLSANTGGKFYKAASVQQLQADLISTEAKSTIHTEESFQSVIKLKWIFWILMIFASVEWFSRKFWGSY